MQFRTKISIPKTGNPINYNSKIVSLGSCFAENMAEKLDYFKFENTCNPFGILFHPLAIEKLIDFAVSGKQFTEEDIFFHNERWHSFDVHSDLSNSSKEELIANLNAIVPSTQQQIKEATHIIITYGTSWVYRNIATNAIVANCHKVPQKQFGKEILSVETIQNSIQNTLDLIQKVNPKATIIFTVSPVRHLKDGFVENQLSKAHLITALHSSNFQLPIFQLFSKLRNHDGRTSRLSILCRRYDSSQPNCDRLYLGTIFRDFYFRRKSFDYERSRNNSKRITASSIQSKFRKSPAIFIETSR